VDSSQVLSAQMGLETPLALRAPDPDPVPSPELARELEPRAGRVVGAQRSCAELSSLPEFHHISRWLQGQVGSARVCVNTNGLVGFPHSHRA
jgi:hypothetical protein